MANNTTPYGRQNVQWPDLGSSPGATLHGQVTAGIAYLSNNITARWSGSLTLGASGTVQITHNFSASLSALKIFVVESGAVLTEALQNASYTFTEISTSVVQVQNTTAGSKTFQVYIFPSKLNIRAADLDAAITITTTGNVTAANIKATTTLKTDDDNLELNSNAAGTGTDYKATITRGGSQSANATITLPSSTSTLATLAGTETLTNKTVTGVVVSDFEDLTHVSTPANPATGKLRFYAKADNKLYVKDSTGTESVVGSGSGSGTKNYLSRYFEGDAVVGTVSTVAVGGAITVSGSFPDVTSAWYANTNSGSSAIAVSSDNTLRGTKNFLTAVTDQTTPLSGDTFVQTPAFNIDGEDLGKALRLQFDVSGVTADGNWDVVVARYNSSGTFQELIPVAGNASSSTSTPSAKLPLGVTKFSGFFITGATASDVYAIRLRRLVNTGSTQIRIDSVTVGPNISLQGAIVTDWVSYTPTWTVANGTDPAIGNGTLLGMWRRVGDTAQIRITMTSGTTTTYGSGASVYWKFGLPSGLNIDSGKITSNRVPLGYARIYSKTQVYQASGSSSNTLTDNMQLGVVALDNVVSDTTKVTVFVGRPNPSNSETVWSSIAPSAMAASTANQAIQLDFETPISQWTANTAMADRAVEEYAYNSSTSASANDTTSFAYGSNGAQIQNITAALTRRVRFQTPILPTDSLIVEVKNSGSSSWVPVTNCPTDTSGNAPVFPWTYQNTTEYGMGSIIVVNSTDVDVRFGAYVWPTGTTYGAAGQAWSGGSPAGGSAFWRVRKVSGGAAVGYPVSARNVVGDTSGNAVPAGYIGEIKQSSNTTGVSTPTATDVEIVNTGVLTPGTYIVSGTVTVSLASGGVYGTGNNKTFVSLVTTTASRGTLGSTLHRTVTPLSTGANISATITYPVTISANTTYYLNVYCEATAGSGTAPTTYGTISAIRIA